MGHVLQDQGDGGDQAGDEAATRQVVAADEDKGRYQQGQGQQQPGHVVEDHRVAVAGPGGALGVDQRMRQVQVLEQAIDTGRGDGQHRHLAEGIEAAEVHQDDVDHVVATATGHRVGQEEVTDVRIGPGQHGIGQQRHQQSQAAGQQDVAQGAQAAGFDGRAIGHEEQRQYQQDDRHHLYRQLGQRQVWRRVAGEQQGHDQAHGAQGHQCLEAVAVKIDGQHRGQHQDAQAQGGERVEG